MKNKRRKSNVGFENILTLMSAPIVRKTEYIPTLTRAPIIQEEARCVPVLIDASVIQRETEYIPSTSTGYEKHEICYSDTRIIASYLIRIIQGLGIEERCTNYNDTWENTKCLFLKEAVKGVKGEDVSLFWESVENFSKIIKEYTK